MEKQYPNKRYFSIPGTTAFAAAMLIFIIGTSLIL
jgi:hypothetical protein